MQQIRVNDLVVDTLGAGGLPVVLVHGSYGGSWYWKNYMERFVARGYTCYAINLRGHAPSPDLGTALGKVSMNDYAEDVRALIRHIGQPVILIGHSMGGLIAQKVCEDTPCRAAVFASSAPPDGVKFKICKPVRFILASLKQLGALKKLTPFMPDWKAARVFALNNMSESEAKQAFARFVPESAQVSLDVGKNKVPCNLSQVKFPMLTLACKLDLTAHWTMQEAIAKKHGTELKNIGAFGHMFMIEKNWEQGADAILDWLQQKKL